MSNLTLCCILLLAVFLRTTDTKDCTTVIHSFDDDCDGCTVAPPLGLFRLFAKKGVECVLLNACYSEVQAEAICQHVDYVIGMNQAIGDQAAINFAVTFYDELGAGETVEFAYRLGYTPIDWAEGSSDFSAEAKTGNCCERNVGINRSG